MPPTTKTAAQHSPSPHTPCATPWAPPRRRKRPRGACCRFIYCACCPCKQTARLHRHGGAILSRVAALSQPNFATARSTLARSQFSDAGQCWCQVSPTACTCVGKESLSATLPEPPSPCPPPHRSLRHPSNERLTLALLRELNFDQMVDDTWGSWRAGGLSISVAPRRDGRRGGEVDGRQPGDLSAWYGSPRLGATHRPQTSSRPYCTVEPRQRGEPQPRAHAWC